MMMMMREMIVIRRDEMMRDREEMTVDGKWCGSRWR